MTVMTTNTAEFDINTLVLLAYQTAGVMNEIQTAEGAQWDARSTFGRRQLELIVDALGADGIFERSMETYELAVTAGQASTEMPTDTIDVRGPAAFLQDDATEFPLMPMARQEYADITIKPATGTPMKYYLARGAPMRMFLWPVPDSDCTIRMQRQRLSYDNRRGASTVDLERYWSDYLVHELASRVANANGMPLDRVMSLQAKAQAAKTAARGKSSGQLPNRIILAHKGPW
jgi:hypothetical protein